MRDIKSEVLAKRWAKLTITQSGEGGAVRRRRAFRSQSSERDSDPPTLSGVIFEPLVGAVTDTGNEVVTMSERDRGGNRLLLL